MAGQNCSASRGRLLALLASALLCIAVFPASVAQAQGGAILIDLINEFRASPPSCEGRRSRPAPALALHAALSRVQVGPGTLLEPALERAGYPVAQAVAISLAGSSDPYAVMAIIERKYCKTLLSTQFSTIGAARDGNHWQVVLARPAPVFQKPDLSASGDVILGAVNAARARGRRCGATYFPAAKPVLWNDALGKAALAHSSDMARQRYYSHQGKDGSTVGARATQAGFRWRAIAENIAKGQNSADEVVADWLSSPGHCANIMNRNYAQMGLAYAIDSSGQRERVYWTQVMGAPR